MRRFALALEDAVDRPSAVLDESARGERGAVPADADKGLRQPRLGRLGEIDDLRNVGEVVAGKSDDIGPPAVEQPEIGGMVLDLQVDQPDRVAGAPRRLRDELEPERLEPQKDLCDIESGPGWTPRNRTGDSSSFTRLVPNP